MSDRGIGRGAVLEFQCRADEYLEARRASLRLRPLEYWLNRAWGPTLLVLGLVVITRAPMDPSGYLVAAVGVALVLNGTLWFHHRVRVEWRTTPSLAYRTWMEISDAGLRLTTVNGEFCVPWSAVKHVMETPTTFTLSRGPDDLRVIPKRAFASGSQVAGFRVRLATECARARSFTFDTKARNPRGRVEEVRAAEEEDSR